MQLTFLGTGSAFTIGADNFQSNLLLTVDNGRKLLIDCGSDIRFSLHKLGMSYLDITDIYISHLHSDHAGGLEYIGLNTLFNPNCKKPNLYLHEKLVSNLWNNTLSGGMYYVQDEVTTLESFFNVFPLTTTQPFEWEGLEFQLIQVIHVKSSLGLMPTYGFFTQFGHQKILFTADTQLSLDVFEHYYERADVIFHDCETSACPTPVHAHFHQLKTLPPEIKRKMWLYGYQPGELPDAKDAGFAGFVKRGQVFEFIV
jgi:ribonuclease BN (tRNA processing enzyme)